MSLTTVTRSFEASTRGSIRISYDPPVSRMICTTHTVTPSSSSKSTLPKFSAGVMSLTGVPAGIHECGSQATPVS